MAKSPVGFSVDTSEAGEFLGFLSKFSVTANTSRVMSPIISYTFNVLAEEFNKYMDMISVADPQKYHHVYEWNMTGNPRSRLWKQMLRGGSSPNNKIATFEFQPSDSIVPVEQPDAVAKGVRATHVFVWKAPIMEYNKTVTISPHGKGMAYFTGPDSQGKWELKFLPAPYTLTVRNPGGKFTTGSFTEAYVAWWSGEGANHAFVSYIQPELERDFGESMIGASRAARKRKSVKTGSISYAGDYEAAFLAGESAATVYMNSLAAKYQTRTRVTRGEDIEDE